jgi:hypothetical protein
MDCFEKMMKRLRPFVFSAGCCLALLNHLKAGQLTFDRLSIGLELPIDMQEGHAMFAFKNSSLAEARIIDIRTDCDCIQAVANPVDISAGKTGEIAIRFHSGLRNGTDVIRAKVVTADNEIYELSVTARLRSYIDVSPLSLHWRKGEARGAKEFLVSSTGLGKTPFCEGNRRENFEG